MPYESGSCENEIKNVSEKIKNIAIPEKNKTSILKFADFCISEGLSGRRVLKYLYTLQAIALRIQINFHKATRTDIEKLVNGIERSDYSEWTKRDFRITLKKFYKWLRNTEEYPPEVKWLRSTIRNKKAKLPDEILTQNEVNALIAAAPTTREKSFIAILYESGCRIGEILNLKMKQVQPHPHGFQITVNGKTGSRRVLLIASSIHLSDWLNKHPQKNTPQAALWITADYRASQISYERMNLILKKIAKRAGINKAVNPHNFRHSRATHLAKHLTEAQMKEYFGWVQGSDMASTYVHLSGRDIDNALLKINKIPVSDEEKCEDDFSIKTCKKCEQNNPPAYKYCSRCGSVLDEKMAIKLASISQQYNQASGFMDKLIQDREFCEMMERKICEISATNNIN